MTMIARTQLSTLFLLSVALLLILSATATIAADESSNAQVDEATSSTGAEPLAIKSSTETFEYRIEGRADPFMPFITERSTRNENPDEIIEEDKILTGMQLFEPSQLTLVALMATENDKFAMVQDFTGKGYIIKEGTKIGRRGAVSEIAPGRVIIEETARTRSGEILTNKIAMVLKKEGEE
ncbi:MAG: pilus assembly protein PilP [Desulfobulbaceae bacterium]|uniref:Type IV pilus assembly protein PilP n=2 Tax=Desulfofustis glycolicus TaxID=51195 RepID=A0A1M5SEM7_9BACT|nr:pilus assembly protein PilP [Desulfobulbaceae bacterium]SHH36880.1 type IV pilus assembly protein PilP [Desulfofustis glycolicus DSM 9705]